MTETASKPIETIKVLDNLTLVKVPGGKFIIGDKKDKNPEITLQPFYMSQYPATQALWQHIMGKNPSNFKGSNRPVEQVSWVDICKKGGFLDILNGQKNIKELLKKKDYADMQFQLPSEAQWEYAARGGPHWQDLFEFSGSNAIDEVAWYRINSHDETKPVGLKAPNQLGLYDMSGNVWEWCADDWTGDYKRIPKDGNPYISTSTRVADRVLRGGSYFFNKQGCRSACREGIGPGFRDSHFGFRLVLCPQFSGTGQYPA